MANKHPRKHHKKQGTRHDDSIESEDRGSQSNINQESDPPAKLASAIRARFAPLGDVELEIPPRQPMREPPDFE